MHAQIGIIIFLTSLVIKLSAAMVANPVSPWSETRLAESFIRNFIQSLRNYGAFSDSELTDISDVTLILVPEVDRIVSEGTPSQNKFRRLNALFATSIADIIAAEIGPMNRDIKITTTERSLVDAFIKTTGLIDEAFVKEIRKLITFFVKEKSKIKQMEGQEKATSNIFVEYQNPGTGIDAAPLPESHQIHQNGEFYRTDSLASRNYDYSNPDKNLPSNSGLHINEINTGHQNGDSNFYRTESLASRNYDYSNPANNLPSNPGPHINEINTERLPESSKIPVKHISPIQTESYVLRSKEHNEFNFPNVPSEGENEIPSSQKEFRLNPDFNGAKQAHFSSGSNSVKKPFIGESGDSKNYESFADKGRDVHSSGLNFKRFTATENEDNISGFNQVHNPKNQLNFASEKLGEESEIFNGLVEQTVGENVNLNVYSPQQLIQQGGKPGIKPDEDNGKYYLNQHWEEYTLKPTFNQEFSQQNLKFDANHDFGKDNFKINLNHDYATDNLNFDSNHEGELKLNLNQGLSKEVFTRQNFDQIAPVNGLNTEKLVMPELHFYPTLHNSEAEIPPNNVATQDYFHGNVPDSIIYQENPIYLESEENDWRQLPEFEASSTQEIDTNLGQTYQYQQSPAKILDNSLVINTQQFFKQNPELSNPISFIPERKDSDTLQNPGTPLQQLPSHNGIFNSSAAVTYGTGFSRVAFDKATQDINPAGSEKVKFPLNEDISETHSFQPSSAMSPAFVNTQTNASQYFNNQYGDEFKNSTSMHNNSAPLDTGSFFYEHSSHANSIHNNVPRQGGNGSQNFRNEYGHQELNIHLNDQGNATTLSAGIFLPENVSYRNTNQSFIPESGMQDKLQTKFLANAAEIKNNEEKSESSGLTQITSADKNAFRKGQEELDKKAFEKKQKSKILSSEKVSSGVESSFQNNRIASEEYEDHKFSAVGIHPTMGLSPEEINSIYQPHALAGSEQRTDSSLDAKIDFEKEIDVITGQIKELLLTKMNTIEKKPTQSIVSAFKSKLKSESTHDAIAPIINKLLINDSFSVEEIPNALSFAFENVKNRDISQGHEVSLLETLVEFSASLVHLLKYSTRGAIDFQDAISTDNLIRDSLLKAFL